MKFSLSRYLLAIFLSASLVSAQPSGGVTQIVAGTNITITPTNGQGRVTINSSGGGGGGVTAIAGTANQITASASTGNVTLSLPSAVIVPGSLATTTYLQVPNQTAPSTPTTAGRLYWDSSNRLSWIGTNGFTRTFDGTSNTANRTYVLPDVSSTLVMLANPAAGVAITNVNSLTAAATTNLTLTGGSSGASVTLGQGTNGAATITAAGSGNVVLASTTGTVTTSRPLSLTDTSGVNSAGITFGTDTTLYRNVAGSLNTDVSTGDARFNLRNSSTTGYSFIGLFNSGAGGRLFSVGTGGSASGAERAGKLYSFDNTSAVVMSAGDGPNGWLFYANGSVGLSVGTTTVTANYSTASTSTTTGAFVVGGGMGVLGTSYFGGSLVATNNNIYFTAIGTGQLARLMASGTASSGVLNLITGDGTGTSGVINLTVPGSNTWAITNNTNLSINPTGAANFTYGANVSNVSITGNLVPSQTNGIVGTTTNNNANAGSVGEVIVSSVASGSAVSLTTGTAANIASISLTAGDWDISGNVNFKYTTATVTGASAGINDVSAVVPTTGAEGYSGLQLTAVTTNDSITIRPARVPIASTTTIYLVGTSTFTGTAAGFGSIIARRRR